MRRLIHLMLSPSCRLARPDRGGESATLACDPGSVPKMRAIPCRFLWIWMAPASKDLWALVDHLDPLSRTSAGAGRRRRTPSVPALAGLGDGAVSRASDPAHRLRKSRAALYRRAGQARARHEHHSPGPRGIEAGAGRHRPRCRKPRQIWRDGHRRWAIWRWRPICRHWIISPKCPGANLPRPPNGMCG